MAAYFFNFRDFRGGRVAKMRSEGRDSRDSETVGEVTKRD